MAEDRVPFGLHTITPYLVVESVATLIQFLQQVFDAESRGDLDLTRFGGHRVKATCAVE